MGYNKVNKLRQYLRIIELTSKHYEVGITTYKGVWRKYIYPVYPISYAVYMKIINMPSIERALDEEERRVGAKPEQTEIENQLKLF